MRKLLWLLPIVWLLVGLLCWSSVQAQYLITDPNAPEMVSYDFDFDGVIVSGITPTFGWEKNNTVYLTDPGGAVRVQIYKDLAPIAVGSHTARYRVDYGPWGVSEWTVPFTFVKPTISLPRPLRLRK